MSSSSFYTQGPNKISQGPTIEREVPVKIKKSRESLINISLLFQ
jgi:hypothetical protein